MKPRFFKTNAHMLVCTGPDCTARGSRVLLKAFGYGLERERLAYYTPGGNLRLTESGCLGACQFGPNLTCYRKRQDGLLEEAWYAGMDYPRCMDVARVLQAKLELPNDGRYDVTEGLKADF